MPRLKPIALLLLAAFTAVALLPSATAVTPNVMLYGQLDYPVPFTSLYPGPPTAPAAPPRDLISPPCQRLTVAMDKLARTFTFSEGLHEKGCLGVVYNVSIPDKARTFEVSFDANRSATQPFSTPGPPDMVQVVRLLVPGGFDQPWEVFKADEGSRQIGHYNHTFEVPPGATVARVEWYFEDRGTLESFSATVYNPSIRFPSIPLGSPVVEVDSGLNPDQEYIAHYTMSIAVPERFLSVATAGQFSLRLEVEALLRQPRVDGPSGLPLPENLYSTTNADGQVTVVIPASTLSANPGAYVVRLDGVETLQTHSTYLFLSFIALGAPGITIAAAWVGLRRTDVEMEGPK